MKVYHYTTEKSWRKINGEDKTPREGEAEPITGLFPFSKLRGRACSYGLLDKIPWQWISSPFPHIFTNLIINLSKMQKERMALLEVDLTPGDPHFVVDYYPMASARESVSGGALSEADLVRVVENAARVYEESKIPLEEYRGQHVLPEVVIGVNIPLDKINLVWSGEARTITDGFLDYLPFRIALGEMPDSTREVYISPTNRFIR